MTRRRPWHGRAAKRSCATARRGGRAVARGPGLGDDLGPRRGDRLQAARRRHRLARPPWSVGRRWGDGKAPCSPGSVRPDDRPPGGSGRPRPSRPPSRRRRMPAPAELKPPSPPSRATVLRLLDRGVALADLGDVGMVRRTTGWRAGAARAPLRGRRASRRRTGHPLPSGCRPARRPSARLPAAALRPPLPRTNSRPGSRTEPDSTGGATRHRAGGFNRRG